MPRFVLPFVTSLLFVAVACTDGPSGSGGRDGGTGDPPESDGSSSVPPSRTNATDETLDVEGTTRAYTLAVPKSYQAGRAYPLVLVLHGDGDDGPRMRQVHPLDAFSGDDAIVAYPSGLDAGWNLYEPSDTNADMKFVTALVAALGDKLGIDTSRVFGVGYSSGGFFINQMACRNNGLFRGIVVHAGGAPNEPNDSSAGQWPSGYTRCAGQVDASEGGGVATLAIHGDNDIPEGGEFVATYWASINGCQASRSATTPELCEKHDGCPPDKPVVWCKIPGLDHRIWEEGAREGWAFIKSL